MTKTALLKELDPIIKRCMKLAKESDPERLMGRLAMLTGSAKDANDEHAVNAMIELAILTKLITKEE